MYPYLKLGLLLKVSRNRIPVCANGILAKRQSMTAVARADPDRIGEDSAKQRCLSSSTAT
ncbi:unnamed protein product [Dovyalis caffra]|uniref:Uncharacterized protein n=1 Tax=Dovyalis caffra TaxID=77055 RepID=A0AAV1SBS9_9ROSI|nr:unnamed protein product [Dovyalis caffra]